MYIYKKVRGWTLCLGDEKGGYDLGMRHIIREEEAWCRGKGMAWYGWEEREVVNERRGSWERKDQLEETAYEKEEEI